MREFDPKIEEMLSGYIDGELSRREHAEVQRLIQNDPDAASYVARLRKQKLLLNSMPVSDAPATTYDDVRAALEREFILDDTAHTTGEKAGRRHLLVRRFATAAIILVMLGGLTAIIMDIVMPEGGSQPLISNDFSIPEPVAMRDEPSAVAMRSRAAAPEAKAMAVAPEASPFVVRLDLATGEPISVNNFVQQQVFNHDLLENTMPTREEGRTVYKITAGVDRLKGFVGELGQAWPKAVSTKLTLVDPAASETDIFVEDADFRQVMQVVSQDDPQKRVELARVFASGGGLEGSMIASAEADVQGDMPDPGRPELASGDGRQLAAEDDPDAEQAVLILTVLKAGEGQQR
ncbi:putative transmembrane transcriptional regulator (anti-sigma factor) [Anaerohalosphaera lusitana]|uniref:Putative transmembrane transcriptional regulator (Anti-sigma factor) n=1 Tax=Anaerohalosphaera lusitana TaxID=1936003 RepID=A0A1U9NPS3_9BACT|nr:hypothetical protein [Anaerohalosphaera lusitana]AQT69744.1 putative transmembrane transcriptional regulator (anti-sigma factor) [Anaerohalosphaera lusitana]